MSALRNNRGVFLPSPHRACVEIALVRFRSFCRFEPATGCVVWVGGTTAGRGHHVRYGSFWYDGRRWFAHRWSATFIHKLDIDESQGDHFCPHISHPNTLCVEHVQPKTLLENRELQTIRAFETRKRAIQLQVGILKYEDIYGPATPPDEDLIPFFNPPAWLGIPETKHGRLDCPF